MPLAPLGIDAPVLAYFGPETMMPLVSIIAAIAGGIMVFSRNILYFFKRLWRKRTDPSV